MNGNSYGMELFARTQRGVEVGDVLSANSPRDDSLDEISQILFARITEAVISHETDDWPCALSCADVIYPARFGGFTARGYSREILLPNNNIILIVVPAPGRPGAATRIPFDMYLRAEHQCMLEADGCATSSSGCPSDRTWGRQSLRPSTNAVPTASDRRGVLLEFDPELLAHCGEKRLRRSRHLGD